MSDEQTNASSLMFERISRDLKSIKSQYKVASDLISAMKEAGEDTAELESDLRKLEVRQDKWERMLDARGFKV